MLGELQKQKLTKVFQIWDTDSNGFLELEDWHRIAERRAKLMGVGLETQEFRNLRALYGTIWETLRESADVNRDNRVSLDEFLSYCDKEVGDLKEVRFDAFPESLRNAFQLIITVIDQDHDGKITAEDNAVFIRNWLGHDATAAAKASFQRRDQDGDGYISIEEAKQHVAEYVLSNDPEAPGNTIFD